MKLVLTYIAGDGFTYSFPVYYSLEGEKETIENEFFEAAFKAHLSYKEYQQKRQDIWNVYSSSDEGYRKSFEELCKEYGYSPNKFTFQNKEFDSLDLFDRDDPDYEILTLEEVWERFD